MVVFVASKRPHQGARKLGIELVPLGFDTSRREDLISNPENLLAHVSNTLQVSKQERLFADTIVKAGQQMALKMCNELYA
jgi:hypothetical protein